MVRVSLQTLLFLSKVLVSLFLQPHSSSLGWDRQILKPFNILFTEACLI